MIRRISGKADPPAISHLKVNNSTIEQSGIIADILASTIVHNSLSDHYTDRFQKLKSRDQKKQITFSSNNQESYNQPFSMDELRAAIRKSHDSATGLDHIHYQMLKNLPESALDTLLRVFNELFVKLLFAANMSCLYSLTWRRPTTRHGSTEYFVIYMKLDCEADYSILFVGFFNER